MNLDYMCEKIEEIVKKRAKSLKDYTNGYNNQIARGLIFLGIIIGSLIGFLLLFILTKLCIYLLIIFLLFCLWTIFVVLFVFMGAIITYYIKEMVIPTIKEN